jgi:transposase
MNTPKADQTTSNTQQIVLPIEIQEPNTKSTDYRQIFPIANIKRGISADQNLLIPIDPSQWLKEDNFIYILTSLLELLDLSKFFSKYRSDGIGASFYHPKNMLGIILYSISRGEYSSHKIERNCVTDIGYWLVGGRITPDHTTIYRFKKDSQEEFSDVFYQIAKIYLKLGLGRFGVIAVDGCKFGCNASLSANHSVKGSSHSFKKHLKNPLIMTMPIMKRELFQKSNNILFPII